MSIAWRVIAGVFAAAVLSAGDAAPKCTLAKIAEWPVRNSIGGPIVDGTINGRTVGILLDTGSTTTLIMRAAAERLGLVRSQVRGPRLFGIGGETTVERVTLDEFAIGAAVRRNWRVLVAGEHDFGNGIAVLLGEDFLQHVDVEFDLPHDAVRLFEAKDCADAPLAYWTSEGAAAIDIDRLFEARPAIEFNVMVNGQPVATKLDSAAFFSVLTKAEAGRLGVTPETPGAAPATCAMGMGQRPLESWTGPFDSFAVGNEVIRNPTLHFADLWKGTSYTATGSRLPIAPAHPQMLLGADFLRAHRVLVAHSQRRIYFTYAGGTVFPVGPAIGCGETKPDGAK